MDGLQRDSLGIPHYIRITLGIPLSEEVEPICLKGFVVFCFVEELFKSVL